MTKNLMAQGDIAGARRERVALVKKIFLFVKIFFMTALSAVGSIYFIWSTYVSQLNTKYEPYFGPGNRSCLQYIQDKPIFAVSCFIISIIACSFVAFLVIHGIQMLVVRFMMRKANTGK